MSDQLPHGRAFVKYVLRKRQVAMMLGYRVPNYTFKTNPPTVPEPTSVELDTVTPCKQYAFYLFRKP